MGQKPEDIGVRLDVKNTPSAPRYFKVENSSNKELSSYDLTNRNVLHTLVPPYCEARN